MLCQLPSWLYATDLFAVAGFPSPGFWSTDYFPLLPWFFLFCAGYFLWGLLSQSERAKERLASGVRPLSFLGRHSLIIYLAHQPVLMGSFWRWANWRVSLSPCIKRASPGGMPLSFLWRLSGPRVSAPCPG